jgi:glycosyltransferase involved in cell wall biosynthesis
MPLHVAIVIPALDEAGAIGTVVRELAEAVRACGHDVTVVVGDNGSRDDTPSIAARAGAVVVHEPVKGYGAACLRALSALPDAVDTVLFADGDGACDPADVAALLAPIAKGRADLVIGSRTLGARLGLVEDDAMTAPQVFGNALATLLLRVLYGHHASDLGPFRAITRRALDVVSMDDRGFGWTVQMQARAARAHLRVAEVPVHFRRRRTGRSKVSGDLVGSARAGVVILGTLARGLVASSPSHGDPRSLRQGTPAGDDEDAPRA